MVPKDYSHTKPRNGSFKMILSETKSSMDEQSHMPAAITDPGVERELNEDRYAVIESPSGLTWLVCDGVGGVSGGELAAQLAIDAMKRDLEHQSKRPPEEALKSALLEANRIIVLRRQNQAFAQMGTTVVAAMFSGSQVAIGHAGDSRAYLVRGRAIQQLTVDHTLVQELVDRGQIKAEDALSHPEAHVLTRCVGAEPGIKVDTSTYWIWPSAQTDILVLCSDGLYSLINEEELSDAVASLTPQKACVRLVELAKSRGGFDNITIAIVPLEGELRDQPPVALNGIKSSRTNTGVFGKNFGNAPSQFNMTTLIVALSVISMMIVMGIMIFMMSS